MNRQDVIKSILLSASNYRAVKASATAFAPSNIALCKYWGKRNEVLNLPINSSLSIGLNQKGTTTTLSLSALNHDSLILNGEVLNPESAVALRLSQFLDLFRPTVQTHFQIVSDTNIPIAAGLASSASSFASIVLALNNLLHWGLGLNELSILARLGSGSASRSLWPGFVEWNMGIQDDGMDSHGIPLPVRWPELRIGILLISTARKTISSREAMQHTIATSPFANAWVNLTKNDLNELKIAITTKDIEALGAVSEANALAMHALMLSARPPVIYSYPETIAAMQTVWQLRRDGYPIFFTQDAGPNLKLLFLEEHENIVKEYFNQIEIIEPFTE